MIDIFSLSAIALIALSTMCLF